MPTTLRVQRLLHLAEIHTRRVLTHSYFKAACLSHLIIAFIADLMSHLKEEIGVNMLFIPTMPVEAD